MGGLSAEQRPIIGQLANEVRSAIEQEIAGRTAALKKEETDRRLVEEAIDVTLPGKGSAMGHKHPLTVVMDDITEIFLGMGFSAVEGPEVELDQYNFEKLNMPKEHPSRDTQDTFYITENILLAHPDLSGTGARDGTNQAPHPRHFTRAGIPL